MNSELCSAGKSLMAQINHKWPSRDTSKDNFTNNTIEISEYMFGEGRGKEQAQELADELNAYRNDKKDGGRLEEITCEDGLHIVFAKEDAEDYSPFKLKIFRFFDDSPNDPQFDKEFVLKKQQLLSKTGFLKDSNPTGEYDSNTDSATREALKKMVSDSPKKNWPKEFSPGGFMPNYPGKDVLKYGQNNDDVKEIQMHLINKGFLTDCAPTGEYNDYTADAVKNFIFRMTKQESDGKHVDEPTWRRIIGGYTGKWLNG